MECSGAGLFASRKRLARLEVNEEEEDDLRGEGLMMKKKKTCSRLAFSSESL